VTGLVPRTVVEDTQTGFTGLNTTADPAHIGPTEITIAANAKFTLFGGVTPRNGTQRMHSAPFAGPVQGIYVWPTPGGSSIPSLCVVAANTLYLAPLVIAGSGPVTLNFTAASGGPFGAPTSGTVRLAGFTDGSAECLYIADSSNLWKYTAATNTVAKLASPPALASVTVQNRRLFGITAASQSLYWSSLDSGDDCGVPSVPGAGGNTVIRTFGESVLTALHAYGPGLVIGHAHGLSTFTGWSQNDIAIQTGTASLSAAIGPVGAASILNVESFAVLAANQGAYVVTPFGFLQQISKPIESLWPSPALVNQLSTVAAGLGTIYTTLLHDETQHTVYFVGARDYGSPILVYNYRTQGWSGPWTFAWTNPFTFSGIGCAAGGYDTTRRWWNFVGCSDGFVRALDVPGLGQDDVLSNGTGGTPYTMQVRTRPLFGADPQSGAPLADREKAWRWVDVQAQLVNPASSQVTATTYPTEGVATTVPNDRPAFNNQPDSSPRTYRVQTGGRGQAVVVDITDTPVNNPSGQNVYMGIRTIGFDYGRRFA